MIVLMAGGIAALMADSVRKARAPAGLRPVDCWFPVEVGFSASCYRFRVPENRSDQASLDLELPVVVISMPATRRRADPIVYLAGGPGDGAWIDAERMGFWWRFVRNNAWLNQRDLLLVDQRGTGNVVPRMDCPELEALMLPLGLGRDTDAAIRMIGEGAGRCHARVESEGHDPSSYTTEESARDLHDIHEALARGPWNVYGLSYGTRLALAYLRLFPSDFRAVILDSSDPPHVDFYGEHAWNTQRAFDTLLDACERDNACRSWYPNLSRRLLALVDRLNVAPIDFDVSTTSTTRTARVG
jgi:pimeloyl-ACP methyl ester carboxylesterase